MPHFSKKQIVMLGSGAALLGIFGALVYFNIMTPTTLPPGGQLVVWGILEKKDFDLLYGEYFKAKGISIGYSKIDEAGYDTYLLNALASGKSPDVFMIRNTWVPQYKDRLIPMPNTPEFTLRNPLHFRATFPQVVEQDFVHGGEIYALPVSLDTLALFYNKDFFDKAAIVRPPQTWEEFQDAIQKLRVMDLGQLKRPAAAIGGSEKTVAYAVDLLSLLMLQSGTPMTDKDHTRANLTGGRPETPQAGFIAFDYYLQFANAGSPYYTWNESQKYSLDAFREGDIAMAFGYERDLQNLKRFGPRSLRVTRAPQPAGSEVAVDSARYWGFAVSRLSYSQEAAWDFIAFIATHADSFLRETGRVPATLTLLDRSLNDVELNVFAAQALTARSWYKPDEKVVENALSGAIADVIAGRKTSSKALRDAQERINQAFYEILTR